MQCLVAELKNLVDDSLRSGVAKLDNDYNVKSLTIKNDIEIDAN